MNFLEKLFGKKKKESEAPKVQYAYSSKCKNRDCQNARRRCSSYCQECSDKFHGVEPIANANTFKEL